MNTDAELVTASTLERYYGRECAQRYLRVCRETRAMGSHEGFTDAYLVGKVR